MDTLIVILIVVAAAFYVGRIFYKGVKQKDGCACGCTCCGISDACSQLETKNMNDAAVVQEDP